ncbi:MAG: DUF4124 domain-containing protein, partial [Nitrospirota bacterium]
MLYDASEHEKKVLPFYVTMWFYPVALAGLIYAAASMAVPVIETRLAERYSAPVKVAYAWVDDDGVTHYSDTRTAPSSEEVVVVDAAKTERIKLIEAEILIQLRRYRPPLEKGFFALLLAAGGISAGGTALSLGRRLKRRHDARSFERALKAGLRDFADLEASVSVGADAGQFRDKLARARASLERCTRSPHAEGPSRGEVVWALGRALRVYDDCIAIWNVASHIELTSPENKG